jgi:hypothetical protein
MGKDREVQKVLQRARELMEKRRKMLSLPPEKVVDRILADPQPAALVHSFPEQDFYFLINEIGPEDSLPLIALASNRQWDHIVDLETWQKDRIEIKSMTRWLNLLLEADPTRFVKWFLQDQLEFIELYLFRNIEIRIREHDQDPSDFGDDYFTLDNTYYLKFVDRPIESESDKLTDEQRREFLTKFAQRLSSRDHSGYQNILLEAAHVIPAETEEDCYRQRNQRLAEKGFLPFDEAVGIYQPIKLRDLEKQSAKYIPQSHDEPVFVPVPIYPFKKMKEDNHFTRALQKIESANVSEHIQTEFANLCNQIIVADHKSIREPEELREIVKKACGYISMGLERLSKDKKVAPHQASALITKYPLGQIFRVGFGRALELKWRVEKWLSNSWFAQEGLRLTFWGERWLGILGGLMIKKPLFYDNYRTGVLYREFASLEDIRLSENVFNQIVAVDELLSLMHIKIDSPAKYGFLTYKNLLLTRWARHYLGLKQDKLKPLTVEQFLPLFEELLPSQAGLNSSQPKKISRKMKISFLNWLSAETGLKDYEITERMGQTFENLFSEIESEYGRVAVNEIDPRFVHLFLLTS